MNRLKLTLTVLAVVGITVLIAALKWQRKRKLANMNLITDSTEADFSPNHPELHHYVDLGGLEGIFKNQTMWATNYRQLNDTTETTILEKPLIAALTSRFRSLVEERQRTTPEVRKAIEETGGELDKISADLARDLVNSFYGTVARGHAPLDYYVTCFCTHAKDDYARENGLLSQWRWYGGADGGYCIVFDTAAMIPLLQKEYEAHYWVLPPKLGDVHYATTNFSIEDIFKPLLEESDKLVSALLTNFAIPEIVTAYFLWAAPLLKHQGFREESEARIVVIPGTQHDLDGVIAEHENVINLPLKAIHERTDARGLRKYVVLFDGLNLTLPIKRVIVGPSRHQDANFDKARGVLGDDIKLVRSDTPFLPLPALLK
jgi:hypothetical protein